MCHMRLRGDTTRRAARVHRRVLRARAYRCSCINDIHDDGNLICCYDKQIIVDDNVGRGANVLYGRYGGGGNGFFFVWVADYRWLTPNEVIHEIVNQYLSGSI